MESSDVGINASADGPTDNGEGSARYPLRAALSQTGLGVALGLVLGGSVGLMADVSQIVELFNHRITTIVLVIGIVAVLGGTILLGRLWRVPPNGLTVVAVALTVLGSVAVGWSIGHTSPSTGHTTSLVASAPGLAVEFDRLPKDPVQQHQKLRIKVTGKLPAETKVYVIVVPELSSEGWPQEPCTSVQGNDPSLFECDVTFGDAIDGRGHWFAVYAVILDYVGIQEVNWLRSQQAGQGIGFPTNNRPFHPVKESPTAHVQREGPA